MSDLDLDAIRSTVDAHVAAGGTAAAAIILEVAPATLLDYAIEQRQRAESAEAEVERLKATLAAAMQLLDYVYVLRAHGEGVDGGNETWREFDRRLEAFLQQQLDEGKQS